MKNQNKKQGFTLVELLVVIAILAILATVSIVGYTAFIKKAHESNALAEANQIKEIIRADLIAGNDFVIKEVENNAETKTVKTQVIRLNVTETTSNYALMLVTVVDGKETAAEPITAETPLTEAFKLVNDKDLAGLFADGNTITWTADGTLVYHYATNNINVVIDLNADTAKIA